MVRGSRASAGAKAPYPTSPGTQGPPLVLRKPCARLTHQSRAPLAPIPHSGGLVWRVAHYYLSIHEARACLSALLSQISLKKMPTVLILSSTSR